MVVTTTTTTFFSLQLTCSDAVQKLTNQPIPYFEVNIHVSSNDIKYGNGTVCEARAVSGSVISFQSTTGKALLSDIFVKNYLAGSNGVVTVVAVIPKE